MSTNNGDSVEPTFGLVTMLNMCPSNYGQTDTDISIC